MKLEPNPSGIQDFYPMYDDVRRNVLSPNMTVEKGDHVGLSGQPKIVHDLNKGLMDVFGPGFLRSVAKYPGNSAGKYYPSAVTATGYTVPLGGALANNLLVFVRGAPTLANNGVKLLAGTSIATEIKTTGLVAEAVTLGNVELEVVGVQGGTTDIAMNASGHLTSVTTDFTTLNLVVGERIFIGGITAATQFATAALKGYATVAAVPTTNLLQLKWHSFTPAADAGTGKTIQLFIGACYRNVADGNADYIEEPAWSMELRDTGVGTANGAVFSYARGAVIDNVSIAMAVKSKIECTLGFMARVVTDPVDVGSRITGPSTAYPLNTSELFDTTNDLYVHRIMDDTNTLLVAEVNSCTLTINHGVKMREQLGTFGAAGMIFGKINPAANMELYYERAAVPRAITANTTCRYEAIMKNAQGGISIDFPNVVLQGGGKTYAEDSPVMMAIAMPAHRDPTTNLVAVISVFAYLPL